MLLALAAVSAHALALAPRAVPLRPVTVTGRGGAPRLTLDETKAALCSKLLYNKQLDDRGEALLQALIDGGEAPAAGEQWWAGKFILRSCHDLALALRAAGGPLLDGSPVTYHALHSHPSYIYP